MPLAAASLTGWHPFQCNVFCPRLCKTAQGELRGGNVTAVLLKKRRRSMLILPVIFDLPMTPSYAYGQRQTNRALASSIEGTGPDGGGEYEDDYNSSQLH
jgi:hypothetical protein